MPENTNSMLSTLRKLRKMKDPEGYIRSLKTEKELLREQTESLTRDLADFKLSLIHLKEELDTDTKWMAIYFFVLILAFTLSHV